MAEKKRALISVTDKRGLVDLAEGLVELGFEIVSTGGTAKEIRGAGISVTEVSDITGVPEGMDGRLKTLHPFVHGGILTRDTEEDRDYLARIGAPGIFDLVVCNLYDFRGTVAQTSDPQQIVEKIDIGGPTMIRAAAKNYQHVTVVVDPDDYPLILEQLRQHGKVPEQMRCRLAGKAFRMTKDYEVEIDGWWGSHLSC